MEVYDQYKSIVVLGELMKLLHNKQCTKPYRMRSVASDFFLAEQDSICQGSMRGDFRHTAFSPTVRKVLDGRYNYPEGFDLATLKLLE